MSYDINTSLERLEQSLKDIESAKQQVEKTVGTSNELQGVVAKYITSLDTLLTSVKEWMTEISSFQSSNITEIEKTIENIRKSCDKVIEKFSAATGEISYNLKKQTLEELSKFESANTKLTTQVDKLENLDEQLKSATSAIDSIKEKLAEVLKELKESQKTQDNLLEAIHKGQEGLCAKSDNIHTLCNEILKSLGTVSDAIKGISAVVSASQKDISGLKKDCDAYTDQLKSEISNLEKKVSSMNNQLETTTKELMKSSDINRWIMIGGIIFLAIILWVCMK